MKKGIMLLAFISQLFSGKAQKNEFSSYPVYTGTDLGLTYTLNKSSFRIWSPTAEKAELIFYKEGTGGSLLQTVEMQKSENGTWVATVTGDYKAKFYSFRIMIKGLWKNEVPDPYVKAVGVNGKRAMVVDLKETNPQQWEKDKMSQDLSFYKQKIISEEICQILNYHEISSAVKYFYKHMT